jgi:hypothetical protein
MSHRISNAEPIGAQRERGDEVYTNRNVGETIEPAVNAARIGKALDIRRHIHRHIHG